MFASIETNGATHIVIHIPHEGADKTLPALARMLEENATFVRFGYQEMSLVKPDTTISLGNELKLEHNDNALAITASDAVLDETFVNATPEVFVSNAKAAAKAREESARQYNEIRVLRDKLAAAEERIKELTEAQEA